MPLILYEHPHWIYIPSFVPNAEPVFDVLYEQVKDKVASYMISSAYSEGKEYPSKRLSCVFSTGQKSSYSEEIPSYPWEDSSVIKAIKEYLESIFDVKFDYVLCHLYRNGEDTIGWHADKEGRTGIIASVSLGATRKFRFRKMGETRGYEEEYDLKGGDTVIMKPSCQWNYLHSVPVQKRIRGPRINLTFRVK